MTSVLFDKRILRQHQHRALSHIRDHSFLYEAVGERLVDRLYEFRRSFKDVLCTGFLGSDLSVWAPHAAQRVIVEGSFGSSAIQTAQQVFQCLPEMCQFDEEALPFVPCSFDLILSCLSFQWTNDVPGALAHMKKTLKPDGVFLASFLGGETLTELRQSLIAAEIACAGGGAPRVSPLMTVMDAAALLQRAGFALPVVDTELLTVTYPSLQRLMHDLRGMGATNILHDRSRCIPRRTLFSCAEDYYRAQFATEEGKLKATFQVITMTGWAPHPDQPKALRPGSAAQNLKDVLEVERD